MPLTTFVHDGSSIDYTPSANINVGDVVVQGDLLGIARRPIAADTLGALAVEGVFDLPKATGAGSAISVGATLYWNTTSKVATTDANGGANKLLGKSVRAAGDADATVRVRLTQ